MRNWNEFHIGFVYFSGLLFSLLAGIAILVFLKPGAFIRKIGSGFEKLYNRSFKPMLLLGGFLGAVSVSFRDCNGQYDYLLRSRKETIFKGLEQAGTSFDYFSFVLFFWLLLFLFIQLRKRRKTLSNDE